MLSTATVETPGMHRRLTPTDAPLLEAFFRTLVSSGATDTFHPHPFTARAAAWICDQSAIDRHPTDEYHAMFEDARIVGYGMLRGWAEGYSIPSLGIAVAPDRRGRGVAGTLMRHLHRVAAARGATAIRLMVYRANTPAIQLYRSLGYQLSPCSTTELLGQRSLVHVFAG